MRPGNGSTSWMLWTSALFVCAILVASPGWASQQDVQEEQATAAPAGEAKPAAEPTAQKPGETADDDDEDAEAEAKSEEPAAPRPGFNTIEDVVAYRGSVASLWTESSAPQPAVTWHDAAPAEKKPH